MPVHLADSPLESVVLGTGKCVDQARQRARECLGANAVASRPGRDPAVVLTVRERRSTPAARTQPRLTAAFDLPVQFLAALRQVSTALAGCDRACDDCRDGVAAPTSSRRSKRSTGAASWPCQLVRREDRANARERCGERVLAELSDWSRLDGSRSGTTRSRRRADGDSSAAARNSARRAGLTWRRPTG